jgi:hypothetical protein
VITCGHLFRSSSGKGRIEADLFAPGATGPVPGKLLSYDLEKDVALVTIWPSTKVEPVEVAVNSHKVRVGDAVFSIGCDRGADASIRESHVTALNKYLGPENIEVAGQPVIGRSGGGLFLADGRLIGICNLADPKDNEGIYAALSLIHEHLAVNLPAGILNRAAQVALIETDLQATGPGDRLTSISSPPPPMSPQMPGVPQADRLAPVPVGMNELTSAVSDAGSGAEVIAIIRDSNGQQKTLIFNQAPRSLLDYLAGEHSRMHGGHPTEIRATDTPNAIASRPDRYQNSANGEVLRGQNQR